LRFTAVLLLTSLPVFGQTLSTAPELDAAINQAIHDDKIPGAVLLVGHKGKVVYRKAYGSRSLLPVKQPMTVDTIFDVASLTKVVATTSCLMKLFEEGKLWPDDLITNYLPEFQGGKSAITVRDLMTHFSGLRPDLDLDPVWSGYETGIHRALIDKPAGPPETKFVYSDINFILLGEIVSRLSGMPENEYVKKILIDPLGMKESGYLPAAFLRPRIAPTEMQPAGKPDAGTIWRGIVHDPTARYMGGVAGHAGLFSTADDLSKFCQMLLDGGDGLFSPVTIRKFSTPASPLGLPGVRGLGWDIDSQYSGNRGELFPAGASFGHTGFTGTSIWIDPGSRTYVILLANSGHPHLRAAVTPLRRQVATLVAKAVGYLQNEPNSVSLPTETGLDILAASRFGIFQGKHVGLITNQTGLDRSGHRNLDLMRAAGVDVVALFSPEHGFAGVEDHENVADNRDPVTGIHVWSLYGKTLRPTREMLKGIDALVFDIQDIGVRFYTFESTMLYAMEEAAKAKIPFYVLDRPNPLTGNHVEGPILDKDKLSFVGAYPSLPLRHGLTIGELASMENAERNLHADLHVISMAGWSREEWYDQTGLPWVNPSPNMRNANEALLYPGLAMLEYSVNYSVGRGTDTPFELIGADWIKGGELADYLARRDIPGVAVKPVTFTPTASHFAGKTISGVSFRITERTLFSSARLGLEVATALATLYPGKIVWDVNKTLIGNEAVINALKQKGDAGKAASEGIAAFEVQRKKYLLY
jgi:uncharacterized protein YbbC (DUF1343 family)/CubicO group peptidase (beta-lactamase class C family)